MVRRDMECHGTYTIWSAMVRIKDMEYHGMYNDMECHATYKRYGVSWYV